ncbi:hypothetical protein N0V88_003119 [Collariella sp. IMI 366227]|nr:hypothetical protein N0V88_003119 [Collariella sp. IMI 366227]
MARAPVVGVAAESRGLVLAPPTAEEIREVQEYEKLLRFRDEILNGAHPRIKPAHLPARVTQTQNLHPASVSAKSAVPAPSKSTAGKKSAGSGRPVIDRFQSQQANQHRNQVNMASKVPGLEAASSASSRAGPLAPGKPEINPVLLEKSDGLIKAEIQLQRQRLERSLKDQFEQRRAHSKASEQLAELDVGDILAKAMSLVLATPPAQSTDDTAANASVSAESVDDNTTFYSSRHDTPESNMVSRLPGSEDEEMRDGSPYEPELDFEPRPSVPPPPAPIQAPQAARATAPGLSFSTSSSTSVYQPQVPSAGGVLQQDQSGRVGHELDRADQRFLDQASREPAVIRAHDLSPLAPQPTHVFPSTIAREARLGGGTQAPPAQVAALRKQPSNGSSPESSLHGGSKGEKKKSKKKKRKAERLAAEAAASPYIKPEPRSPSPLTPQYGRPSKRQRHSQQQPVEIQDDEPRFEQPPPVEGGYQEHYQPRVVRQERVVGYERADEYRARLGEEPILVTSPRYERVYYDDHRAPPQGGYTAGPESAQYIRTVRPASRIVHGPYDDVAPVYSDGRSASRMSIRPTGYPERSQSPVMYERPPAAMPPPRAAPRRIIVDAYGREYLEPVRSATVVREEVVSDFRGPYERVLPPAGISRRPELLDDEAALYRPTSPAYAATSTTARRVVTQPEYAYRETAPPTSTMGPPPPAEYARADPPREYLPRSASVRPMEAQPRYDAAPRSVYERVVPAQEYYRAASARPAAAERYEMPVPAGYERRLAVDEPIPVAIRGDYPPPMRSASVRPVGEGYEMPGGVREYARVEYTPVTGARYQDVVMGAGRRQCRFRR